MNLAMSPIYSPALIQTLPNKYTILTLIAAQQIQVVDTSLMYQADHGNGLYDTVKVTVLFVVLATVITIYIFFFFTIIKY